MWIGQAVSLVGDYVFDTTLLLWLATMLLEGRPYAPLVSGGVLVLASAVILVVGPIAGVLVDRWPNKLRTMRRADLARAALIGVLAVVACLPAGTIPLVVELVVIGVVVAATTAVSQLFNPARFVLIGDVVPAEHRGRATGYGQATGALAAIIGPPLAAPLLFAAGVQWALVINAVSFLVSYVMISAVRVEQATASPAGPAQSEPAGSVRTELIDGLRFIAGNRVLTAIFVSIVMAVLGVGALQALDVYFVQENLHADPKRWFGYLGTAFGVGGLIGALVGGWIADRMGPARTYCTALLAFAVCFIGYARATSIWPGLAAVAGFSLALGVLNTAASPLMLKIIPRHYQGRVLSVFTMANRLPELGAMLLSTLLVSTVLRHLDVTVAGIHLGRVDAVFLAGGLLVLAAGLYATRALHTIDRTWAHEPEEDPAVLSSYESGGR
ncbi:MFS transporter [Krasilnikovia sp. M28-CT-15]